MVDPGSGDTPAGETDTVTVTVSRDGLAPGEYTGVASVTSNGGDQDVTVIMDVGITIAGTVEVVGEEVPLPGAQVAVVEYEAEGVSAITSEDPPGRFVLENVPPSEKMHVVVRGPEGPVDYVETYIPYFTTGTEDIDLDDPGVDIVVPVLRKGVVDLMLFLVSADPEKGVIAGTIQTQVGDVFEGVAGVKVSLVDMDDNPIDAPVVYTNPAGIPDLTLEETSTDGVFVFYNIDSGLPRDVKVVAEKDGWVFFDPIEVALTGTAVPKPVKAKVYPYRASPESVTVAPITGQVAQGCPHCGDCNLDGDLTPGDALMVFQHYLGIADPPLDPCQLDQAEVTLDDEITPADALCIFQKYLGIPSCLDDRPQCPWD